MNEQSREMETRCECVVTALLEAGEEAVQAVTEVHQALPVRVYTQ